MIEARKKKDSVHPELQARKCLLARNIVYQTTPSSQFHAILQRLHIKDHFIVISHTLQEATAYCTSYFFTKLQEMEFKFTDLQMTRVVYPHAGVLYRSASTRHAYKLHDRYLNPRLLCEVRYFVDICTLATSREQPSPQQLSPLLLET